MLQTLVRDFVTEGLRALLLAGARESVCRSFDRLYRKSFARAPANARLARAAARPRTWEDLREGLHICVVSERADTYQHTLALLLAGAPGRTYGRAYTSQGLHIRSIRSRCCSPVHLGGA